MAIELAKPTARGEASYWRIDNVTIQRKVGEAKTEFIMSGYTENDNKTQEPQERRVMLIDNEAVTAAIDVIVAEGYKAISIEQEWAEGQEV